MLIKKILPYNISPKSKKQLKKVKTKMQKNSSYLMIAVAIMIERPML